MTIAKRVVPAAEKSTARPRRKRLSAVDRRASILAAAAEVFAETGYHRGKVADVAARVGVSEPVVFQNFGSKAALYAAVLDMAAEHMSMALESGFLTAPPDDLTGPVANADAEIGATGETLTPRPPIPSGPTGVLDLLTRILSPGHLDWLHTAHAPGALFADAVSLTADPEIADAARRAVRRIADTLADLLAQGRRAGDVRSDLDPEAGAWLVLTLLASHGFRAAVMPDRERLETELARLALGSLAAGPDRSESGSLHD